MPSSTARRRRRGRRRPPKNIRIVSGPFVGMRDSLDPTSAEPHLARVLRNCYATDAQHPAHIVGRPGFVQAGAQTAASEAGQWCGQFTKLDGTEYTVKISGGIIYTYNWSSNAWTAAVTRANLTTALITFSTTRRVYCVTFVNELVISDGVNLPFSWDGASGAGGITSVSNAAVMFGQPIVHYAKLIGIKDAERSTFVWSEENQINTGYEAGVFNNAWTLGQTDQNQLFRLYPLNEVLYAFRARSITGIYGSVTSNFSSSGTRESVSETEGTVSPGSVYSIGRNVFFLNADRQPHMIVPGGGPPHPIWHDYRETLEGINVDQIEDAECYFDPSLDLGVMWMTEYESTVRSVALTYQMRGSSAQAAGIFDGLAISRVGIVKNVAGDPRVMHLDGDGNAYYHGHPEGAVWDDDGVAIEHRITSPFHGYDPQIEKYWSRVDLGIHIRSNLTNAGLYVDTPSGCGTPQTMPAITSSFARFDVAIFDTDRFGGGAIEQHLAIGLGEWGRWMSWTFQHDTLNEQFGLEAGSVDANVLGPFPATL